MGKYSFRGRLASVVLVVGLAYVLTILSGCKQKDPPEDAQQSVEDQETERGLTYEVVADYGTHEKHDLRILYVGLPDTDRQKDFIRFLSQHFKQVDTADYNTFEEDQAKDCDVVILDKDGIEWKPLDIKISSQYSRATISLGVPGAFWCSGLGLKTGYMWNCLTDAAHGESFDHVVFHKPLKVGIKLETVDTPSSYSRTVPEGKEIGKKMQVWYVQKAITGIKGVVSRVIKPGNSDEAEAILLGFAPGKRYESVGIGRHGNFLQWGYASAPSHMTEAGRNLFVNCICYIRHFDGKGPTTRNSH